MCESNKQSIDINYSDMVNDLHTIAYWVAEEPSTIMPILNQIAFEVVLSFYHEYHAIHSEVYIKLKNFFLEEDLRNIRQKHLNKMLKIRGVVTRRYRLYLDQQFSPN